MKVKKDSLGDRMKEAEKAGRISLPKRLPLIIRVDGRAFHSVTKGCQKPFDHNLVGAMNQVAIALCLEIQGAVLAYVQSDEISILVHNYKTRETQAWYDNDLQKVVSISAATAAVAFSQAWGKPVAFDSRAFVLPEFEVNNYFVWRQNDAMRNSLQMICRSVYSHSKVNHKKRSEMHEMLKEKGIKWEDYPIGLQRGRTIALKSYWKDAKDRDGQPIRVKRSFWKIEDPPIFSQKREYVNSTFMPADDEGEA